MLRALHLKGPVGGLPERAEPGRGRPRGPHARGQRLAPRTRASVSGPLGRFGRFGRLGARVWGEAFAASLAGDVWHFWGGIFGEANFGQGVLGGVFGLERRGWRTVFLAAAHKARPPGLQVPKGFHSTASCVRWGLFYGFVHFDARWDMFLGFSLDMCGLRVPRKLVHGHLEPCQSLGLSGRLLEYQVLTATHLGQSAKP